MGVSPDRIRVLFGVRKSWLAVMSGIAGIALTVAVEAFAGMSGSAPVIRYEPTPPVTHTAIAARPQIAFGVNPNVAQLEVAFRQAGYNLTQVRKSNKPVPRLRLATLPQGLKDIRDTERRKKLFLSVALPLILEANTHVAVERRMLRYVSAMIRSGQTPPQNLRSWLERLARRYGTEPDRLDVLLERVDVVPVSLALAQAAIESGWGTSRFARQGNAIFGQWTTAGGDGLVPSAREEGKTHKVRSFDRLSESVAAYLLNLNTHRAYAKFRALRKEARRRGERPDGWTLALGLDAYSEKGEEYVELLREMIRVNNLTAFDDAILSDRLVGFESGV